MRLIWSKVHTHNIDSHTQSHAHTHTVCSPWRRCLFAVQNSLWMCMCMREYPEKVAAMAETVGAEELYESDWRGVALTLKQDEDEEKKNDK